MIRCAHQQLSVQESLLEPVVLPSILIGVADGASFVDYFFALMADGVLVWLVNLLRVLMIPPRAITDQCLPTIEDKKNT